MAGLILFYVSEHVDKFYGLEFFIACLRFIVFYIEALLFGLFFAYINHMLSYNLRR